MNESVGLSTFDSRAYWERRYASGGNSGAGSRGELLVYKAAVINAFIFANRIASVIDFGCGDGRLLALLQAPSYVGIDVSPTVLARCRSRFADRPEIAFAATDELGAGANADLTMSIDVIFHLVEDAAYDSYLAQLFGRASRFVLIYASNCDVTWPADHVRHRRFAARTPDGWRLAAHIPNPYSFDPARPDETSFADFFVYARAGAGCTVSLPETREPPR